jgi:prepilin-type N-terminal cleavage/methylation domain-containing protein
MSRCDAPRRGFTLIELLVAISILALLAVFSWRTLDAITRTSDALKVSSERIDALARVFAALENDCALANNADLPARGELRLMAAGGGVAYEVQNNQLMRTLAGGEPGLIATGVTSMRVDIMRAAEINLNNIAAQGASLNNSLAGSSGTAPASPGGGTAGTASGATPANKPVVEQRVVGVKVALTLDNGDVVTRLLLLNAA